MKTLKIIKKIGKFLLLWLTILSSIALLCGAESVVDNYGWLPVGFWLTINAGLIYITYNTLTLREFYRWTGNNI